MGVRSLAPHRRTELNVKEAVRAAAEIFAVYGGFIRAVIRFQAKNQFREDDFYQDFFLSLVRRPIPVEVRNIKSYLYRAIRNDIIDIMRRQVRQQEFFPKYAQEFRISINNRKPTDALIVGEERVATFGYLTRQLRHREAEAFTLRYRDQCSIADIAARMGIDKRSVSRYLTAGMRRLREDLAIE